ncbi:hypothetical protein C8A00DRAFT_14440 [Chaetomidium leptoderma]|uniref:Uncharacterized protein n=1 Tax=Chaetomidium leptoderma TaxID=669021 RepID=A0AAN6ZY42_9PEZI|nr:hypothetical protein C8A00DRAFT_14440 [Chaetomidium leptoderma]
MAEHSPKRNEMEPRRASDSVTTDTGTQTEEGPAPAQQSTTNSSLTRTRSLGRDRQLAQRPPSGDAQVGRRPGEVVAPRHHNDRGGAPALRLDMDLDVDINLQAKIKGEIELSIL